ncbi:gliding motility lipoprotein GldH [Mangrovibacterium sp.]|uniref:gliding motility lipoprotein GldH n=1 Tax=Mangrovibacterium sp. TaxID=1961364 RepID=UPI00356B404A
MKLKSLLALSALLIGIISCNQKSEFEAYHTLDTSGWHKDSLVVFPVPLSDTLTSHNVYLNIRNAGNYEFSNIWLFMQIKAPDGNILTDTLELQLADPTGKWTGSGIGDLFDNQFIYKKNVFFPASGTYEFSVQQGMRATMLKGIQDVGLRIEKRDE